MLGSDVMKGGGGESFRQLLKIKVEPFRLKDPHPTLKKKNSCLLKLLNAWHFGEAGALLRLLTINIQNQFNFRHTL